MAAAALGQSGGEWWQNCPWCLPTAFRAKPATVISFTEDVGFDEEKHFSMTQVEEDNYAARIIQRGWRWTRERIGIRAEREKLQEQLREARRRIVVALPVGASSKKKAETLREMQSTMNAEEKELRKLLTKELARLEFDLLRPLQENRMVICGGFAQSSIPTLQAVSTLVSSGT